MTNQYTEWFILNDQNEQEGPMSDLTVRQLFSMGRIGPTTLVWTQGLANWSTYENEFPSSVPPETVPRIAKTPVVEAVIQSQPKSEALSRFFGGIHRPWRRWFARFVDLNLCGSLLGIGVFAVLYVIAPGFASSVSQVVANPFVDGAMLLLLWMPLECACIATFGSTPGKWLLGIRITDPHGSPLNFRSSLKRYVGMMVQGAGLGLPIVVLFTYIASYRRLTNTGTTAWDESSNARVTHSNLSGFRYVGATVGVVGTFCFIALLRSLGASK